MSNSGISWAICKSAPRSRQITTPVPHHSVFYRPDALPAAQPTASKHRRHSKHWRHRLDIRREAEKQKRIAIKLLFDISVDVSYFPEHHIFQSSSKRGVVAWPSSCPSPLRGSELMKGSRSVHDNQSIHEQCLWFFRRNAATTAAADVVIYNVHNKHRLDSASHSCSNSFSDDLLGEQLFAWKWTKIVCWTKMKSCPNFRQLAWNGTVWCVRCCFTRITFFHVESRANQWVENTIFQLLQ